MKRFSGQVDKYELLSAQTIDCLQRFLSQHGKGSTHDCCMDSVIRVSGNFHRLLILSEVVNLVLVRKEPMADSSQDGGSFQRSVDKNKFHTNRPDVDLRTD